MNESPHSAASPDSFASHESASPPHESMPGKAARTVVEGLALLIFAQALSVVLTVAGATFFVQSKSQTKGVDQLLSGNLLLFVCLAVVMAPVVEEAIFRGIPNLVMRATTASGTPARQVVWVIFGLASSLLFAALHGVNSSGSGPASIAFETLPLPQLAVGLWAWHVATLRGLRYSMMLHAVFNGVAVALALLALALGYKI